MDALLQTVLGGVVTGAGYALLGAALVLIVGTTGRFHFAIGVSFTLAAYIAVAVSPHVPIAVTVLVAMAVAALSGILIERCVYEPVERAAPGRALLTVFVVAFGLVVLTENVIRLAMPDGGGVRRVEGLTDAPRSLLGVPTTTLDLVQVGYVAVVLGVTVFVLSRTRVGREIRAVRSNRELAGLFGIRPRRVHLLVFAIGSAMVAGLAVIAALRVSAVPTMGFTPAFYGFVIAFLTGLDRPVVWALVPGLAVGIAERVVLLWLTPARTQVVIFGLMFVLLAARAVAGNRRVLAARARRRGGRVPVAAAG